MRRRHTAWYVPSHGDGGGRSLCLTSCPIPDARWITSSEASGAQIDVARSASIGLRSTHSQTHQEQTEWPEINGKVYVKKKEAAKNIQNCFPG